MAYVVQRNKRFTGYYRKGNKRLSAGTWNTKVEAEYHAVKAEASGAEERSRTNMRLADYIESWLPVADVLPITKKGYEAVLRTHVLPRIGNKKVSQVTRRVIRDLLDDLKHDGVGSATIAQVKASLGSSFKPLIETDELSSNPTHGIKIKKTNADFQNVLEPEEFKLILEHLPEPAQLFAQFLVTSGTRFGEATELRVKDFNFKNGEVYIQRRVSDLGAKYNKGNRFLVVEATKSGYKRSITLSKALLQEIKDYVSVNQLKKDNLLFSRALVLPTSKLESSRGTKSSRPFENDGRTFQHGTLYAYSTGGCRCDDCKQAIREYRKSYRQSKGIQQRTSHTDTSHLPRDVWRNVWNTAIAKSGIDWSPRTHDLRHANATALLKNGVDVHEVKERLGHQSIKTTERYLHRIRHQQSKAGELANDFLE